MMPSNLKLTKKMGSVSLERIENKSFIILSIPKKKVVSLNK